MPLTKTGKERRGILEEKEKPSSIKKSQKTIRVKRRIIFQALP